MAVCKCGGNKKTPPALLQWVLIIARIGGAIVFLFKYLGA